MKYIYIQTKNNKVQYNSQPYTDPGDVARSISECEDPKDFKKFGVAKIPVPKEFDIIPFSKFGDYYFEEDD